MRRGQKTSAEQVVLKLRQIEVQTAQGKSLALACKEAEISEQSYYRWRKEYGGLQVDQARKMKDWPAAGFTDTRFRCDDEAGGAPCSDASLDVSSRSRQFDWFGNVASVLRRPRAISMFTRRCCTGG